MKCRHQSHKGITGYVTRTDKRARSIVFEAPGIDRQVKDFIGF